MHLRKHPRFALLFTALLVIFCRGPQTSASWLGPGCTVYNNYLQNGELFGRNDQYNCPIPCPDGSTVTGEGQEGDKYADVQADGLKKCSAPAATATPTATTTPEDPTSTPTATATPQPLLSGEVKACNLTDHYINFSLASGAVQPVGQTLEVTWNAQPVQCEVPSTNKNILSCILPQTQTFPAQISISIDGHLTDRFTYDGSDCIKSVPAKKEDPPQNPDTGLPTCTGDPPYPEGCNPP